MMKSGVIFSGQKLREFVESAAAAKSDNNDIAAAAATIRKADKNKNAAFENLEELFDGAKKPSFESLWGDSRQLEEEVEALKWMARRKEMEWDSTRYLIIKKKADIKHAKRRINMVRTINDLGPQLNVDSDDEDTPYEDDDDDDDDEDVVDGEPDDFAQPRRPRPPRRPQPKFILPKFELPKLILNTASFSQKEKDANFVMVPAAGNKRLKPSFSKGHLCLGCKIKPPLFVCHGCKNHWYCSKTCQEDHWSIHEPNCNEHSDPMLQSSSALSAIDRFQESLMPDASDLLKLAREQQKNIDHDLDHDLDELLPKKADKKSTNCLMCCINEPKYVCGQCKNYWYCSLTCHEKHWPEHASQCK
jgi:hypothetical protein